MNVTLLGPQRITTAARSAVHELIPDGPIATVNSGWQEREADDATLNDVLGGRMRNLNLYRRWREVRDHDPDFAAGEERLDELLDELQTFYVVRLQHAMAAVHAVERRREQPSVQQEALSDAIRAVQDLDEWHLRAINETRQEFREAYRPGERPAIAAHRAQVADLVRDCAGMIFTGGHVSILLRTIRTFDVMSLFKPPIIAWSAGAMVLSERVILYHDMAPQGPAEAEVYAEGFALYRGVLPFPHAKRRLRMSDDAHLGLMARRFQPRACLLLADGERVDLVDGEPLPVGARTLDPNGGVSIVETAA